MSATAVLLVKTGPPVLGVGVRAAHQPDLKSPHSDARMGPSQSSDRLNQLTSL